MVSVAALLTANAQGMLAGMNFDVDWIDGDEPGLVMVSFATHHGSVHVD